MKSKRIPDERRSEFNRQVTIWMRPETHTALRIRAAETNTSMQSIADQILTAGLGIERVAPKASIAS